VRSRSGCRRTPTVEGFIWPETNRFPTKGTTADDVITTGLDQFGAAVKDLPGSPPPWTSPRTGHGDRLDDREGSLIDADRR
jgi:hypothetical protein